MSPGAGAKKRLGVGGGVGGGGVFTLGCGCRDAKAVAVAVAASSSASPYSSATATDTSTATTATWRRARAAAALHPSSASGSTGTLTVPSASSSSFVWEDAEGDAGEEVDCKRRERDSSAPTTTTSFSGLLRQLNELEQSVVSWGRKSTSKDGFSPQPPPPPPPPPPFPPPLPVRPVKQRLVHSGVDSKEGHGNFSPPPPPPPPPPFQLQTTQQHRKARSMEKADRQAGEVHSKQPPPPPPPPPLPLPPEQSLKAKSADKGDKKEDASILPTSQAAAPKHRKAKSCDGGTGAGRLNGTVAVVKQSDDPLSDFRRSMVNMIVENRIATGDELRELLRHFLALNAPRHHDAILRAFTEIWDEAFSSSAAKAATLHREPAPRQATPPRPRTKAPTPPRRRHAPPPRVWR